MIQIEINGERRGLAPTSMKELQDLLALAVPRGHGVCIFRVNGRDIADAELASFDLASVRGIEMRSEPLAEIARRSVRETREWIGRICGVLESISSDYRLGRETAGAGRLVQLVDALQVLVHLLEGIHAHMELGDEVRRRIAPQWAGAHSSLCEAIEGIASDLESGDAVQLADRTGYALPRCLGTFRELLGQLPV
jgi:hypothetical protein